MEITGISPSEVGDMIQTAELLYRSFPAIVDYIKQVSEELAAYVLPIIASGGYAYMTVLDSQSGSSAWGEEHHYSEVDGDFERMTQMTSNPDKE